MPLWSGKSLAFKPRRIEGIRMWETPRGVVENFSDVVAFFLALVDWFQVHFSVVTSPFDRLATAAQRGNRAMGKMWCW